MLHYQRFTHTYIVPSMLYTSLQQVAYIQNHKTKALNTEHCFWDTNLQPETLKTKRFRYCNRCRWKHTTPFKIHHKYRLNVTSVTELTFPLNFNIIYKIAIMYIPTDKYYFHFHIFWDYHPTRHNCFDRV